MKHLQNLDHNIKVEPVKEQVLFADHSSAVGSSVRRILEWEERSSVKYSPNFGPNLGAGQKQRQVKNTQNETGFPVQNQVKTKKKGLLSNLV